MTINTDRKWWNDLDNIWQNEFISNLLNSPGCIGKKMLPAEIFLMIEKSDEIITDIVNLEKLQISSKVLFDLTPVFYLKKINDFHIQPPDWEEADASFLYLYPKHLRSKVHRLDIDGLFFENDLSPLSDFVNLEVLNCQSCRIESLDGIQKLTKLKIFNADQGNSYSDLNPLRGLGIVNLNMQFTKVTDISPLIDVPTLEHLDICYLKIKDLTPLLQLPNLKTVTLGYDRELTLNLKELKFYLNRRGDLHPGITSIKKTSNFKKNNTWYLLPLDPSDFGPLFAGRVLVDPPAFNTRDLDDPFSQLIIFDFTELCCHLSTSLIFPVELDPDTLVDKIDDHSWYVTKVKLLEPVDVWQLLRNSFHNIHQGNINFSGQLTIPEKAQLPTVLYGDLIFRGNLLHPGLSLPAKIKGELKFEFCNIPSVLKFPYELDTLVFQECSLEQSYKFAFETAPEIFIESCILLDKFIFPDITYKGLSFSNMTITASLELPDSFIGSLVFDHCLFASGFKLPSTINGELAIRFPEISGRLQLPSNGEYQLIISDESELLNYDLPDSVRDKVKNDKDDLPF